MNHNVRALLFLLLVGLVPMNAAENDRKEHVVLLHGLGRTQWSMAFIERDLKRLGYTVHNLHYRSRSRAIPALTDAYLAPLIERIEAADPSRIHFVTHSMGGIIVRDYLSRHPMPKRGHCVFIAPPSAGSEIIDRLGARRPVSWIVGPAGRQLGTDDESMPSTLPHVAISASQKIGVIAGDRSYDPLGSALISGRDDGKVSIERTRIPEADHIVVPATHTSILWKKCARKQVTTFLEKGKFQ